MSTDANFVAPTGAIQQMSFNAPASTVGKEKNPNLQMLAAGMNPGIIYSVVDLGTQTLQFPGQAPEEKRQIMIGIEFPQLKQIYYVGDTEARPAVVSDEMTMFIASDKSNLRKLVHAVLGRAISDQEALSFDLFSLLGQRVGVNISHRFKKSDNTPYMKIDSYFSLNANIVIPQNFEPTLERQAFVIDCDPQGNVIGNNFMTVNFANLYKFVRDKIMNSREGQIYKQRGGKFAELPRQDQNSGQQAQYPQQTQAQPQQASQMAPPVQNGVAAPTQQRVEMLVNDFTYEGYIGGGWTDELLVQHGKAKWIQQLPQQPTAPAQAPSAPVQQFQQRAQAQPQFAQQAPQAAQPVQQAPADTTFDNYQTPSFAPQAGGPDDLPF